MRLHALSDLHLGHPENRAALAATAPRPGDWLALVGDLGESLEHLRFAFETLGPRFERLIWTPGNHELWTLPGGADPARGEARYRQLVEFCRSYGVLTPEDPFEVMEVDGERIRVAPLFLLYDYSFRPSSVAYENAVAWAARGGVHCTDEILLHTDPYEDVAAWCAARCALTEARLQEACDLPLVLLNHFPLRQDIIALSRIPRFSIWCGSRRTEDWHLRFGARVVVCGHLHLPTITYRDGVRFEEVSWGYPGQRRRGATIESRIRQILP